MLNSRKRTQQVLWNQRKFQKTNSKRTQNEAQNAAKASLKCAKELKRTQKGTPTWQSKAKVRRGRRGEGKRIT